MPKDMKIEATHINVKSKISIQKNYGFKKYITLPTSLVITFTGLQICFGYDYGFSKAFHGRIRSVIKIFSVFAFIVSFLTYLSPIYDVSDQFWYWITYIKYVILCVLFKSTKYNLYDYLIDLHSVSFRIATVLNDSFSIAFSIYFCFMYFSSLVLQIFCAFGEIESRDIKNPVHHICFDLVYCSIDALPGVSMVIGYYLYLFIKTNKEILESNNNLPLFEHHHVKIVDLYAKIQPLYNKMVIFQLCINTPRLMVTLWCMLSYIKENAGWFLYTNESLVAFYLMMQICIPAVIAEMVNCQMDAIKLILNEQLRVERDKEKSSEVLRVLRYVKARRLQSDIWRVIPVDLRLILALLSLYTSYFIVILQFTHLYD